MIRPLIILLLLAAGIKTGAQVYCPTNVDFEQNNFSGWYLYTGKCCPIVMSPASPSGPVATRHTITNDPTVLDPYGGFPIVSPDGGNYSLKLGNIATGSQAERARYYIQVPNNLNNYSLLLRYAVVFQNPTHTAAEQPRFEVKAFDSATSAPIQCVQFSFVASSTLPGFTLSSQGTSVFYKPWSVASLNLSGMAGKTIAVDFSSGDCTQGGHFGYGYVDLSCGLFQIASIVCKGSVNSTLSAPPGFEQYEWYDSTLQNPVGTGQTISVPTPSYYNRYYVVLTPYTGYGCPDTLQTELYISDLKIKSPPDTSICSGDSVQLTSSASATGKFLPLTYSWSPATSLSCTTCLDPNASPAVTTKYILTVKDATGCMARDTTQVTIRLRVDSMPSSIAQCLYSKAMLRVKVSGIPPFQFEWLKNGVPIPGSNNDTLFFPSLNYSDTASYSVIIRGSCDSIIAGPAKVSVFLPENITAILQPQPVIACNGKRAVFRFKATGKYPLQYQWFRNGKPIAGATKDSLVISSATIADSGYYRVMAKGQCDTLYSDSVPLYVNPLTSIVQQPRAITACPGKQVVLNVKGVGTGLITYQWQKNNINIPGATADSLVINPLAYADSGLYRVLVKSTCDSLFSVAAKLTVILPTLILQQPQDASFSCFGARTVFRVKARSQGTLTYQWMKNGLPIGGATKDSLVLPNTGNADIASYSVMVRGECDSVLSNFVALDIFSKPSSIVSQPQSLLVCPKEKAIFRFAATNPGTSLQYSWKHNNTMIPGGLLDSLVINSALPADSGKYVAMARSYCDTVISDTVTLSLKATTRILSAPLLTNKCLGENFTFRVVASGDGLITYQWKRDNVIIPGATADSLQITTISYADSGNYSVIVRSTCDSVESSKLVLRINLPTSITLQPQDVKACPQGRAVVRVKAQGSGTLGYRWRKNGVNIASANRDSLVFPNLNGTDTGTYDVFIMGGCDSIHSNSVRVGLHPVPQSSLPASIRLCRHIGSISLDGFSSYLWSTGATTAYTAISQTGDYWVRYTDSNSCSNADTTHVMMDSLPAVYAGRDTILCNELDLALNGFAFNYDSARWLDNTYGDYLQSTSLTTVFHPAAGLKNTMMLSLAAMNYCGTQTDELLVQYVPKTKAEFSVPDTLFCEGADSVKLQTLHTGGLFNGTYVNLGYFNPQKPGRYAITYQLSENGCTDSSLLYVTVLPKPEAHFSYKPSIPDIDNPVVFAPTGSRNALNYRWDLGNGNYSNADSPSFYYKEEGIYNVVLYAVHLICTDSSTQAVEINGSNHIWVPNAFTPNDDGNNDGFQVVYHNKRGGTLTIYNRWGQKVFNGDLTQSWDGSFEGKYCPQDVYVYVVQYVDNESKGRTLRGNVTLLR